MLIKPVKLLLSIFKKNKKAFTILEMIIVLLVMGLITVAVISGASIVEQAGNRAIMGELKSIQENVYLFNLALGGIPGDFASPTRISTAISCPSTTAIGAYAFTSPLAGNGDGKISPTAGVSLSGANSASTIAETYIVWCHLYMFGAPFGKFGIASSLDGTSATMTALNTIASIAPASKSGRGSYNLYYDSTSLNANVVKLYSATMGSGGAFGDISTHSNTAGVLTPKQAISILNKFDNGLANSGNMFVFDTAGTSGKCISTTDASQVDITLAGGCLLVYKIW